VKTRPLFGSVVSDSLEVMSIGQDRQTVALARRVVEKARELSAFTSKNGWASLGIDREDPATMSAIFEEGLNLLATRMKTKGKK
jgi:hypothetical protein